MVSCLLAVVEGRLCSVAVEPAAFRWRGLAEIEAGETADCAPLGPRGSGQLLGVRGEGAAVPALRMGPWVSVLGGGCAAPWACEGGVEGERSRGRLGWPCRAPSPLAGSAVLLSPSPPRYRRGCGARSEPLCSPQRQEGFLLAGTRGRGRDGSRSRALGRTGRRGVRVGTLGMRVKEHGAADSTCRVQGVGLLPDHLGRQIHRSSRLSYTLPCVCLQCPPRFSLALLVQGPLGEEGKRAFVTHGETLSCWHPHYFFFFFLVLIWERIGGGKASCTTRSPCSCSITRSPDGLPR